MKQLFRQSANVGSLAYQLEKGQWGLFAIRYEGTNLTGQAITLADLGNIVIRWNGTDIINLDFEALNYMSNLYGGVSEFSSTSGGQFKAVAFIPTGLWFDSTNVWDVDETDKVEFVLNWNTSKIASGSVYIFGKPKRGVMSYLHGIKKRSVNSTGAGTQIDSIPVPNITTFYIKNPSVLLSKVQVARDGKVYVDGSVGIIQNYSDWIHLLETSNSFLAIEFVESKDIREALASSVSYIFEFTSSGILETYYSHLIERSDKVEISLARASL